MGRIHINMPFNNGIITMLIIIFIITVMINMFYSGPAEKKNAFLSHSENDEC